MFTKIYTATEAWSHYCGIAIVASPDIVGLTDFDFSYVGSVERHATCYSRNGMVEPWKTS